MQLLLLGRFGPITDIISDITDIIAVIANCIGQQDADSPGFTYSLITGSLRLAHPCRTLHNKTACRRCMRHSGNHRASCRHLLARQPPSYCPCAALALRRLFSLYVSSLVRFMQRPFWFTPFYRPAHRLDTIRSRLHDIAASSGVGLSFRSDLLAASSPQRPYAPACSARNRATRKGRENFSVRKDFPEPPENSSPDGFRISPLRAVRTPFGDTGTRPAQKGRAATPKGGQEKWKRPRFRSPRASRASIRTVKVWAMCPGSLAASR